MYFISGMDILTRDFKKGFVKLKINDLDDLWYLSHLIDPGDLVRGKTTRKIKIGEGDNATVTKKTLTLSIEAETIELGSAGTTLRVNGKVKEGPEDVPKGSYHTITLEEGSEFALEKVQWLAYQKKKLEEAAEKKYNYLLCLCDREEAIFALTKKFGYEILVKITGEVAKKFRNVDVLKDFYQEIIKAIDIYNGRYNPERIIIASPAFYKEDLVKKITSGDIKKKIVLATSSSVDERAIDEVFKRPELAHVLKTSRAREEQLFVDDLLQEINKNQLAVYGKEQVMKSITAGAVRILLITDKYIQQQREKGNYQAIDEAMKKVDHLQGEIHILNSALESGKIVDGLGGIAAVVRYKIE